MGTKIFQPYTGLIEKDAIINALQGKSPEEAKRFMAEVRKKVQAIIKSLKLQLDFAYNRKDFAEIKALEEKSSEKLELLNFIDERLKS